MGLFSPVLSPSFVMRQEEGQRGLHTQKRVGPGAALGGAKKKERQTWHYWKTRVTVFTCFAFSNNHLETLFSFSLWSFQLCSQWEKTLFSTCSCLCFQWQNQHCILILSWCLCLLEYADLHLTLFWWELGQLISFSRENNSIQFTVQSHLPWVTYITAHVSHPLIVPPLSADSTSDGATMFALSCQWSLSGNIKFATSTALVFKKNNFLPICHLPQCFQHYCRSTRRTRRGSKVQLSGGSKSAVGTSESYICKYDLLCTLCCLLKPQFFHHYHLTRVVDINRNFPQRWSRVHMSPVCLFKTSVNVDWI